MNVFFAKFWIRVVRSMKNLPMSVREALAKVIARILWLAIPKRRHVIETNLRPSFPSPSVARWHIVSMSALRALPSITARFGNPTRRRFRSS